MSRDAGNRSRVYGCWERAPKGDTEAEGRRRDRTDRGGRGGRRPPAARAAAEQASRYGAPGRFATTACVVYELWRLVRRAAEWAQHSWNSRDSYDAFIRHAAAHAETGAADRWRTSAKPAMARVVLLPLAVGRAEDPPADLGPTRRLRASRTARDQREAPRRGRLPRQRSTGGSYGSVHIDLARRAQT